MWSDGGVFLISSGRLKKHDANPVNTGAIGLSGTGEIGVNLWLKVLFAVTTQVC